jgi:hypothetical protein
MWVFREHQDLPKKDLTEKGSLARCESQAGLIDPTRACSACPQLGSSQARMMMNSMCAETAPSSGSFALCLAL